MAEIERGSEIVGNGVRYSGARGERSKEYGRMRRNVTAATAEITGRCP